MKGSIRFLTTLTACIGASFAVSLLAVHAFWIGAKLSHSVPLARTSHTIGSLILLPSRVTLLLLDAMVGSSTILPEPRLLAAINGVFLGVGICAWLQRGRSKSAPSSPRHPAGKL